MDARREGELTSIKNRTTVERKSERELGHEVADLEAEPALHDRVNESYGPFADVRGVRNPKTTATISSAGTSPMRCPRCSGYAIDCAAMIPPCTTLDQTVNQIRLRFASGSRAAMRRNTPSVA